MAGKTLSAGILMYKIYQQRLSVFLVHPGGPFFAKKDDGFWTIPKGLPMENESLEQTARREFQEETAIEVSGALHYLGETVQKGGKTVHAFGYEVSIDMPVVWSSNTFEIEWPPKSGKMKKFPEVDKGAFFELDEAERKINAAQIVFITRLVEYLNLKIAR